MSPGSTPFVSKLVPLLYQLESRMDASNIDLNELFVSAKKSLTQFGSQDFAFLALGLLGLLALVDLAFYAMAFFAGREAGFHSITKSVMKTGLREFKRRDSNPFGLFIEPLAKFGEVEAFLPALDHIAAAAEKWD